LKNQYREERKRENKENGRKAMEKARKR